MRAYNLLKRNGVETVGDLLDLDMSEFLAINGVGTRIFTEVSDMQWELFRQEIRGEL